MSFPTADAARFYQSRGWSPIPIEPRKKRPSISDWQNTTLDLESYDAIFDNQNLGVVLGKKSGNLFDADLDSLTVVRIAKHFIPKTPAIFGRLSKPESHHIYQGLTSDEIGRITFKDENGKILAEIRGDGNQTMFPPSVHPSGEEILWIDPSVPEPETVPLAEVVRALGWACAAAMCINAWDTWDGKHHDLIGAFAGGLFRSGIQLPTVENFLKCVLIYSGDHEPHDRLSMIRSTYQRLQDDPKAPVTGFPTLRELIGSTFVAKLIAMMRLPKGSDGSDSETTLTDDGNAKRYVEAYKDEMRYCPQMGQWFAWNDKYWRKDETETHIAKAREIPRMILNEITETFDEEKAKHYTKWAHASRNVSRIVAIPKLAQTDLTMQIHNSELNRDPMLFNVKNGTLNLRTGGLQPHDRNDLLTNIAPVIFDPRAKAPRFMQLLDKVFDHDQELIGFVQKAIGYSMTALTSEQVFFLLFGPPGTGKSTFIHPFMILFGDYTVNADPTTFIQKQNNSRSSSDIARLQYARLVTTSETEEHNRLATSLVKRLTGSTRVTASFLYHDEFEFEPVMKIWIDTNFKPRISANDGAIWDRLVSIPFIVNIRNTPDDVKGFRDYLESELPGILNWSLEGALLWQSEGLARPEKVRLTAEEYRNENDALALFIEEHCITGPEAKIGVRALFETYTTWAERSNERPWRFRTFNQAIEERGFTKKETMRGYEWTGITLMTAQAQRPDANPFDRPQA